MATTRKFDLVVVGTGSAAAAVAFRCRKAGWTIAIVDSRPFGGTCALRGCDPKKVLVGAAEIVDRARLLAGKGIDPRSIRIAWRDLTQFKQSLIAEVPRRRADGFAKAGIAAFQGRARFVAPTALQVGDDVLEGRHVMIGAGARPADVTFPGAQHLTTSEQFLELDELPSRLVFVGGGYISFEFAHMAARAGADVTILHRGARPLVRFDPDLVDQLAARTRALGVDLQLEAQVTGIERANRYLRVRTSARGQESSFDADMAVHGAGRVPEVDDLALEAGGVQWDPRRGVKVNQFLQSVSNPAVYAGGDAADSGGPPLTPVAGYDGGVIAANLLEGNHLTTDYSVVPSVVFTVPQIASVGLHERDAREQGRRFTVKREDTSAWYSSRRIGETCSGYKVLVEESTGWILGAHLLGPAAEETINLFALAMRAGISASQMKETLFAYPTHASDTPYML